MQHFIAILPSYSIQHVFSLKSAHFRPHRMQLMMQGSYMRPISTDEMTWSVSVCILSTPVSPAETDEPIEMPLGERLDQSVRMR